MKIVDLSDVLQAFDPSTLGPDGSTLLSETDWLNLSLAYLVTPQFGSFSELAITSSTARTLAQNNAHTQTTMSPAVYNAICGGLLDLATGPWLDFWAAGTYNGEKRTPPGQQVQTLWFAIVSAINLAPNDLIAGTPTGEPSYTPVIEDPNNPGSYIPMGISIPVPGSNGTYQPAGTVLAYDASSGTYPILVQALSTSPGSAGQSTPGEINTIIQPTGLPVQFVSDLDPTTGVQSIIVRGQDQESDILFRDRLRAMWPALSRAVTGPKGAWSAMTKQGCPRVRRVAVREACPSAGYLTLSVDPESEVSNVNKWFNGPLSDPSTSYYPPLNNTTNIGHRPLNSTVIVQAPAYTPIALGGTVYCAQAAINAAKNTLAAYLAKFQSSTLFGPLIYYSLILATIQNLTGVDHIDGFEMNGGVDDVQVPLANLPSFDATSLQWVPV